MFPVYLYCTLLNTPKLIYESTVCVDDLETGQPFLCQTRSKHTHTVGCLTCDSLEQSTDVEYALPHDALEAQAEDGDAGHSSKYQRACCQKQHGGLPEAAMIFFSLLRYISYNHPYL